MTVTTSNASNADPFAAASMAQTAGEKPPVDPNANPFATPDSVGGGGPRGPKWAEIAGRLVVLKPLELRKDVPMDPKIDPTPGKVQDIYVCDLTVLGKDSIRVWDPTSGPIGTDGTPAGAEVAYDAPYTWSKWFAYGAGVKVKLLGVDKDPSKLFLLGVVRRCPTGQGYKRGQTPDDVEREWSAYRAALAAGREVPKPQFSWGIVDPTPEQSAEALAWYRGLK
jgi:hypothetical protein